jgi:hypothetical protein
MAKPGCALAMVLALLSGCGGARPSGPDAGAQDGGYSPASHAPLPQIPTRGGAVLAHPQIVTVTFSGDPLADSIEAWGDWVVGSAWLAAVGADYGVGAGQHLAKVRLAQAAPAQAAQADIQAFVSARIADGSFPAPRQDVLYVLYYPASTMLAHKTDVYCQDFSGYHNATSAQGTLVPFAVVGRCATFWIGLSEWQNVQRTASHELIEAATDPALAFDIATAADRDAAQALRAAVGEGEVGDVCTGTVIDVESGFVAQRSWSNAAAASGADPCVPASPAPYFSVSAPAWWYPVSPGTSVVIPLVGWSAAPVADWIVRSRFGVNTGGFTLQTSSPTTMLLDGGAFASTNNGRSLMLTVTAPASASSGSYAGIEVRSITPSAEVAPDQTREARYHYLPVGVYVP